MTGQEILGIWIGWVFICLAIGFTLYALYSWFKDQYKGKDDEHKRD